MIDCLSSDKEWRARYVRNTFCRRAIADNVRKVLAKQKGEEINQTMHHTQQSRRTFLTGVIVTALALFLSLTLLIPPKVQAAGTNYSLIAFGVKTNSTGTTVTEIGWGRGNSDKGWREGDWVPVKLTITSVQSSYAGLVGFPDIYIGFDFTAGPDSVRFVDLVRDIQVGETDLTDAQGWPQSNGTPYPTGMVEPNPPVDLPTLAAVHTAQTSVGQNQWTGFTLVQNDSLVNYPYGATSSTIGTRPGTVTDDKHEFKVPASAITSHVAPTTDTIIVYFQAHLARTFVWKNALEQQYQNAPYGPWGGSLYADSIYTHDSRLGSSYVPGSSGHMYVNMTGQGNITCQLPIPVRPTGTVTGLKWSDLDANGAKSVTEPVLSGWTMHLRGTDPEGLVFDISTVTDAQGVYAFPDLTEATWKVAEYKDRTTPS